MISSTFILALLPLLVSGAPVQKRAVEVVTKTTFVVLPSTVTLTVTATPTLDSSATPTFATPVDSDSESQAAVPTTIPVLPATTAILATQDEPSLPAPTQKSKKSDKLMMAYYPDWAGPAFPPEKVDFNRFDWVDFAFALPDEHFSLTWDDPEGAPKLLKRLVSAAHAKNKKVKLSIGGWTGSKYFSPAVASDASRLIFVNNIVATYHLYNLDGIDIDWEYPGQPGNAGNIIDTPHDTTNYLSFLRLLRASLPPSAVISSAALVTPWVDAAGQPTRDMAAFATVLDWVLIMNYDVWGSSPTPGPNAPLSDGCGNSTQPNANAEAAVRTWTTAGFPADKLVLGLPAYGYISASSAERLHGRAFPRRAAGDAAPIVVKNEAGSTSNGQIQFRELLRQGALVDAWINPETGERETPNYGFGYAADPEFVGARGYESHWDECSSTPFLRSETAGQVITYDNPTSIRLKAELAVTLGLKGVNMFDVHGDTDEWDLSDSALRGLYNRFR